MQQVKRIQFITKYYNMLQGLVLVPFGIYCLFISIWNTWLRPAIFPQGFDVLGELLFLAISIAILLALIYLAQIYYRWKFGLVKASPQSTGMLVAELIGIFVLIMIGMSIDERLHPHVSAVGLLVTVILCVHWQLLNRMQRHYLIIAGIFVILSLLPLFSNTLYTQVFLSGPDQYGNILNTIAGLTFVTCGILDHLVLTRTMAQARRTAQTANE
ncbi:MAG: hypothetical protein H0W02_19280 [Ktedonobacteraceae bacterium]|nr:hypothetical protein [Ktedonobacteraceae bacterium]